ncbi:MAG: hypothetical protein GF355_00445, partial [Candidatus Eisenbacteria bacterium]|nr:hypothetical protein [Candidatus Eisenbacteria bacterium]
MNSIRNRVWLSGVVLSVWLVLGICMTFPGLAQDEPAPAEGTEETAPAEEAEGEPAVPPAEDQPLVPDEEPQAPAEAERETTSGVLELFQAGGNFMWPLLLTSIIGLAVILERMFT